MNGNLADIFDLKFIVLTVLIFVPFERLLPMHPGQKIFRPAWKNDLIYLFFNRLLIKLGLGIFSTGIIIVADELMPRSFQATVVAQPLSFQVIEVIFLADLGFYSAHRLFHAIPWLWKFHKIHHSIQELDWLAGHRVHPLDQIATKAASLALIFPLGFSGKAVIIYSLLYHWQSILLHANVGIGFGPLRWLIASPQFHHWHHSSNRLVYNKNFAGQLSLLDALLGTLHMPRGYLPDKYGIDDALPGTYFSQLLYPFKNIRPVGLLEIASGFARDSFSGPGVRRKRASELFRRARDA